jgi:hypothetical protein
LLDWRAQSKSFDGIAGFMTRSFGLRGGQGDAGTPVSAIMAGMVTSDLFHVLGNGPYMGRAFSEREELQGEPLIVLTDELWSRQFHREPRLIGRTVQLNDQQYQVIGILPPGFVFPSPGTRVDACIPISHRDYNARGAKPLEAVARLKPDEALLLGHRRRTGTAARSRTPAGTSGSRRSSACGRAWWSARSDPGLSRSVTAPVRSVDPNPERVNLRRLDNWVSASLGDRRLPAILTGLFAAVGLLLTALGLYGTVALEIGHRRREMAIRVALGASRASITRLVLKRGLLLTLAGAMAGMLGFVAVGRAIESQLHEAAPSDPASAAVVVVILFACAACACLRPAWDASRQPPISVLREM